MMKRIGGEERRAQLVAEAVRLFGRRGFDGASLDDIAEAAGVRKQTLLYYFPTKDALFDACVHVLASRIAETLEVALSPEAQGGIERVERVVDALFALAEEWPEFPMFVREASWRGADVVERFAGVLEPLRLRALEYLERGMEEGTFRRQDPPLLLFTLYTAVVGSLTEAGVLRAVAGGESGSLALKRRKEELLRFLRNALLP